LKGCSDACTAANKYIELESQHADGAFASKILAIKEKTLTALDRTFQIEMMFMEAMAGGAGQTMLLDKVAATLPTKEKPCTPQETLSRMSQLFSSSLYAFPSKQAQQSASFIRTGVTQIAMRRRPQPLDAKCGPEVRQCYERMSNYLVHQVLDAKNKLTKLVYGKEALDLLHAGIKMRVAANEEYTMGDLNYGRFFWLLDGTQSQELKAWTKKLMPSWDGNLGSEEPLQDTEQNSAQRRNQRIQEATEEQAVDDVFA
jgi:hypothetical protein